MPENICSVSTIFILYTGNWICRLCSRYWRIIRNDLLNYTSCIYLICMFIPLYAKIINNQNHPFVSREILTSRGCSWLKKQLKVYHWKVSLFFFSPFNFLILKYEETPRQQLIATNTPENPHTRKYTHQLFCILCVAAGRRPLGNFFFPEI